MAKLAARIKTLESETSVTQRKIDKIPLAPLSEQVSSMHDKIDLLEGKLQSVVKNVKCTRTDQAATSALVAQLADTCAKHGEGLAAHTKCLDTCGISMKSLHASHAATKDDIAALSKTLLTYDDVDTQKQELEHHMQDLKTARHEEGNGRHTEAIRERILFIGVCVCLLLQ